MNECTSHWIKQLARQEGFDRVGITTADATGQGALLDQWLAAGYAGSMAYLHRHREQRLDPRRLVAGARSVICAAISYHQPLPPQPNDRLTGRIARYAWGRDYHKVIRKKLRRIVGQIRDRVGEGLSARVCVDSAPVMERQLAARAGVGWIGKNGLVLHQSTGSYLLLGEIICNVELEPDRPAVDHCGSCRRCLEACPTQAFPQPYVLDASRCLSYTTIEHRGEAPEDLRAKTGDWVFGCDICQEVCPYNRKAPNTTEPDFAIRLPAPFPDLQELLHWTEADRAKLLAGSAIKRATLPMLRRNAAVALANLSRPSAPFGPA